MNASVDHFRPTHEPAATIYDALLFEAKNRRIRANCDEWIIAERNAVYQAAVNFAQQNHRKVPTMEEIVRAEDSACGHSDYATKFAIRVAELLR